MNIKIKNLLCYRQAQKFIQVLGGTCLGFIVSGLEYMKISVPGCEPFEVGNGTLLLLPAGTKLEFSFNDRRCNYFSSCDIVWNEDSVADFDDLPFALKVEEKRFDFMLELFNSAEKLANSPILRNHTAAELLLNGVLSEFVKQTEDNVSAVPQAVAELKKAVDEDTAFQYDISELMNGIDCSHGHLRRLFKEYYQTGVAEYRSRMRLTKIKTLMLDYNLSMKEIADSAGMKNVTHLHSFIKKHCNMTPKKLRNNLGR